MLMPCYFCAGAAVQYGIKKVTKGEVRGIELIDPDPGECVTLMQEFIAGNIRLWNEDIG